MSQRTSSSVQFCLTNSQNPKANYFIIMYVKYKHMKSTTNDNLTKWVQIIRLWKPYLKYFFKMQHMMKDEEKQDVFVMCSLWLPQCNKVKDNDPKLL